ncbi:ABC transporter ATP-binding protein [Nitrospina sp. 32_T5]|uniref:ABC transporter ATP-binding protein n=1 Tax=unclassified Nitrospina TaxID=2638683 RepID=UPI003F9D4C4B
MTDQIAISVKNVSKKYRLFNSPKERFWEALHPFRKIYHREFWALKEISLEIPKGATVGIIGRNGSGKTTLLQIICSILKPTIGSVEIQGSIGMLLSLGAGLNPNFTGRENVRLKGMLLGLSIKQINEKIPEIEEFADIGQFFDQPLKTYSAGMMLRLAFSIVTTIHPDILIIDEIIAVGDAKFKQKCYQKFRNYQEAGKTILLTTHDNNAILKHCNHALLLDSGNLISTGEPKDIVNQYLNILEGKSSGDISTSAKNSHLKDRSYRNTSSPNQEKKLPEILNQFFREIPDQDNCPTRNSYNKNETRKPFYKAEIIDYLIVCDNNFDPLSIASGKKIEVYIKARFHELVEFPLMGVAIRTVDGILIYGFNSFYTKGDLSKANAGDVKLGKITLSLKLNSGDYFLDLGVDLKENEGSPGYINLDRRSYVAHLNIIERNKFFGLADLGGNFQEISKNEIYPICKQENSF